MGSVRDALREAAQEAGQQRPFHVGINRHPAWRPCKPSSWRPAAEDHEVDHVARISCLSPMRLDPPEQRLIDSGDRSTRFATATVAPESGANTSTCTLNDAEQTSLPPRLTPSERTPPDGGRTSSDMPDDERLCDVGLADAPNQRAASTPASAGYRKQIAETARDALAQSCSRRRRRSPSLSPKTPRARPAGLRGW